MDIRKASGHYAGDKMLHRALSRMLDDAGDAGRCRCVEYIPNKAVSSSSHIALIMMAVACHSLYVIGTSDY